MRCVALSLPLASALAYVAICQPGMPAGAIMPLLGGAIMNLGFWHFYEKTIGPITELSQSMFGRKDNFLITGALHFVAMPIPLLIDVSSLFGLL